ncbi:MAG: hypothetical protein WKF60_03785, partial [Ilumatobacter sp.]
MKPALRSEVLKLRSIRTPLVVAALGITLEIVLKVLQVALLDNQLAADLAAQRDALKPTIVLPAFAAVIGTLVVTPEWRYSTFVPVVQVAPDRRRLVRAKLLVAGALGVVVGLLAVGSSTL